MSNEWPRKTIAECAADEPYSTQIGPFGKALTPEEYTPSGVPLLRGINVNHGRFYDDGFVFISEETADRLSKFESFPGDVLLVHKGTLGQIGIMPKNRKYHRYIMGNSMLRVKCNTTKLIPEYLYYWLCSDEGQHYLFSRVSQVGVPQIQKPLTTLREASLPVPPLSEQKAIAHILSSFDDKIELNRQINETLEAMARAIFKSWFVDFDPVRAKKSGRQPAGMDATTADLFPDDFEESSLDLIPKGWRVKALPEFIEINPKRSLAKGKIAPYLDMKNMPTQGHRPDDWIDRPFGSGTKFINGDTLMARITPCLENGKTAFVDFLQNEQVGWGSTEYIIFRSKPPLPLEFAYYLARYEEFKIFAIQNMTGSSGRQRTPADCFYQYLMAVPSEQVALKFGDLVQPLMVMISANGEQSQNLINLRDTLLPKLMSGQIRVKEAEKIMEKLT